MHPAAITGKHLREGGTMPAQREHLVDVSVGKLQQQSPLRTQELPIQKRTEKDEVPVVRDAVDRKSVV